MWPPWTVHVHRERPERMTPAQVARAPDRAAAAGRRYPNLVDNMAILREDKHPPKRRR